VRAKPRIGSRSVDNEACMLKQPRAAIPATGDTAQAIGEEKAAVRKASRRR
jgi:hypothetical protein